MIVNLGTSGLLHLVVVETVFLNVTTLSIARKRIVQEIFKYSVFLAGNVTVDNWQKIHRHNDFDTF